MRVKSCRNLAYSTALVLTLVASSTHGATITVGKPDDDGGKVTWKVNNTIVEIVVPASTLPAGKAVLLENELKRVGFKGVTRNGAAVQVPWVGKEKIEKLRDETHEEDKVAMALPFQGGVDFHLLTPGTALAGLNETDDESLFSASLGFDLGNNSYQANASIEYGDIPGTPSIDSLLSLMLADLQADLPSQFASGLSLDLSNEAIRFAFPAGASSGFVQSYTTDQNAYSTLDLESVPETLRAGHSLLAAAVSLFAVRRWTSRSSLHRP